MRFNNFKDRAIELLLDPKITGAGLAILILYKVVFKVDSALLIIGICVLGILTYMTGVAVMNQKREIDGYIDGESEINRIIDEISEQKPYLEQMSSIDLKNSKRINSGKVVFMLADGKHTIIPSILAILTGLVFLVWSSWWPLILSSGESKRISYAFFVGIITAIFIYVISEKFINNILLRNKVLIDEVFLTQNHLFKSSTYKWSDFNKINARRQFLISQVNSVTEFAEFRVVLEFIGHQDQIRANEKNHFSLIFKVNEGLMLINEIGYLANKHNFTFTNEISNQ